MRPNLITRLKEEWNNLDPVDPLRGLIADAIDELTQPAQQQCRTDGRCQYAIDSGAEGMGHCPKGKCVMPVQQQEPVAWMVDVDLADYQGQSEYRTILSWNAKPVWSGTHEINEVRKSVPLYTSPPVSNPWVGLTDEQRHAYDYLGPDVYDAITKTEARLKEKNA